jgi:hypothetical protein
MSPFEKMNDELIRESFHRNFLKKYHASPDTLVLNELGLRHGSCRADIAVVNGSLTGFEIKSNSDTLDRLPLQVKYYSSIFDRASVITGTKHRETVKKHLPEWWGIIVCHNSEIRGVQFEVLRQANRNTEVEALAVAQLLWKNEAANILQKMGEPLSVFRQRRSFLYERLVDMVDLTKLQKLVRDCLKMRKSWRRLEPLFQCGGLSLPSAK